MKTHGSKRPDLLYYIYVAWIAQKPFFVHTSVIQCFGRCTRWGLHQWCGACVRASSATLQHETVPTNTSIPAPPLPSAPPLRLPLQMEQLLSPQEVTLEGDRQCSAVVIVTTKGLTKIGWERGRTRERTWPPSTHTVHTHYGAVLHLQPVLNNTKTHCIYCWHVQHNIEVIFQILHCDPVLMCLHFS